jgi:hypothetical protein
LNGYMTRIMNCTAITLGWAECGHMHLLDPFDSNCVKRRIFWSSMLELHLIGWMHIPTETDHHSCWKVYHQNGWKSSLIWAKIVKTEWYRYVI